MDHNFAIANHTAERYLMRELNETDREAYEEHFFSCTACAEEIKSASEFMESARRVIQDELKSDELKSEVYSHAARHSIWGSWLNWRSMLQPFPAMASALLALVSAFTIYQNRVTIPQLAQQASAAQPVPAVQAQLLPAGMFALTESRGDQNVVSAHRGKPFRLQFDVTLTGFNSYQADITTDSGIRKFTCNISMQEAMDPVQILVPPLGPGDYFVVIQGIKSNVADSGVKGETVRLPFHLNVQD